MNTPSLPRHCYKIVLSYDGTNYCGWQIQPHAQSIQHIIQETLSKRLRQPITLIGSGRTDSGVHALGQVAHFHSEYPIVTKQTLHALNCMLPQDIRILSLEEVSPSFHAQYDAKSKVYYYHLCLQPITPPFQRLYCFKPVECLDLTLLKEASACFLGTHDFTSFANSPREGCAAKNPVRTLYRLDVVSTELGIRLEFQGSGFLYKMVRNITGLLLEISGKKRALDEIQPIFHAKDRRAAGKSAPARGLFLAQVNY